MQTLIKFLIAPFFLVGMVFSFIEVSFNGGRIWMESFFEEVFGEYITVVEDEENE